ncbi:MAG: DUF2784 family protein, partial [Gemmataceae bacterium]
EHSVVVAFVLFFLAGEAALLAGCWRLFGPRPGQREMSAAFATALLVGQALIPLTWLGLKAGWETLSDVQRADVLAVAHFGFIVPVVLLQLLIVAGGVLGWRWVRNYWLRVAHLVLIALVVIQAVVGHECPVNEFERTLRGGDLAQLDGASALGRFCNRMVYQRVEDMRPMLVQYAAFGVVVIASWYLVRPAWPAPAPVETENR